jgi:hypothetical protein
MAAMKSSRCEASGTSAGRPEVSSWPMTPTPGANPSMTCQYPRQA